MSVNLSYFGGVLHKRFVLEDAYCIVFKQSLWYFCYILDPVQLSYNACKGSWDLGAFFNWIDSRTACNSNDYSRKIRCAFRDNQRSTRVPFTNSLSSNSASTNPVRDQVGRASCDRHWYVPQDSWHGTIHYNDMLNCFGNFCYKFSIIFSTSFMWLPYTTSNLFQTHGAMAQWKFMDSPVSYVKTSRLKRSNTVMYKLRMCLTPKLKCSFDCC